MPAWIKDTGVYRRARWVKKQVESMLESPQSKRHALVGNAKLWEVKRAFQIDLLSGWAEHTLFDIGCGTLRGGIPLIEYLAPGNYYGADVRAIAIAKGLKELVDCKREDAPNVFMTRPLETLELGRRFGPTRSSTGRSPSSGGTSPTRARSTPT